MNDHNTSNKNRIIAALFATAGLCFGGVASANPELAAAKNCLACHAVDHKLVGPGYTDVAKKYAGDSTAQARLANKILKGGGGVWGPIPMPANTQVSEAEANQLAAWVLSLK
jgi:cytochrome c